MIATDERGEGTPRLRILTVHGADFEVTATGKGVQFYVMDAASVLDREGTQALARMLVGVLIGRALDEALCELRREVLGLRRVDAKHGSRAADALFGSLSRVADAIDRFGLALGARTRGRCRRRSRRAKACR